MSYSRLWNCGNACALAAAAFGRGAKLLGILLRVGFDHHVHHVRDLAGIMLDPYDLAIDDLHAKAGFHACREFRQLSLGLPRGRQIPAEHTFDVHADSVLTMALIRLSAKLDLPLALFAIESDLPCVFLVTTPRIRELYGASFQNRIRRARRSRKLDVHPAGDVASRSRIAEFVFCEFTIAGGVLLTAVAAFITRVELVVIPIARFREMIVLTGSMCGIGSRVNFVLTGFTSSSI